MHLCRDCDIFENDFGGIEISVDGLGESPGDAGKVRVHPQVDFGCPAIERTQSGLDSGVGFKLLKSGLQFFLVSVLKKKSQSTGYQNNAETEKKDYCQCGEYQRFLRMGHPARFWSLI